MSNNRIRDRQVARTMIFGYLGVGLLMVLAAWFSISRIQTELQQVGNHHEKALESLLIIDGLANDGAQELFAYLISGDTAEYIDFQAAVEKISNDSVHFASIAHLSDPGEEEALRLFADMQTTWSHFITNAEMLASEYAKTGSVSQPAFQVAEESLDQYFKQIDSLLVIEQAVVHSSRERKDTIVEESTLLLASLAGFGVLALLGIGAYVTRQVSGYVAQLKKSDDDLEIRSAALDSTGVGICFTDADENNIIYANDALLDMTGYSQHEIIGKNPRFLQGEGTNKDDVAELEQALQTGQPISKLILNYRKNGDPFWNELVISPTQDSEHNITHWVGAMHDVTDRVELETQLLRAQKMEAVGQLAGGVAHDFNNYLMVINGYAENIARTYDDADLQSQAGQIVEAGKRSAELTRQLLAFSRRQVLVPQILDLNRVIMDLDPLLRRTLGEQISLETVSSGGLGLVSADQSQIEQVLLNLVVNARDSMPAGGSITIETGNVFLDSEYVNRVKNSHQGRHVMIAVSDTGTGIAPEIRERIFEPFFTTKQSAGSGLGLSTVVGIVEQSGGTVQVYSEPGEGTTFKIYLPRINGKVEPRPVAEQDWDLDVQGTVLVVEDEAMVRDITCQMVRGLGLSVLQAEDGLVGLEVLKDKGSEIDILLTDVMLPGMGGKELADQASKMHPELIIVYMSGYTENGILHQGRLDPGIQLLEKPFTNNELRRMLTSVLAKRAEETS